MGSENKLFLCYACRRELPTCIFYCRLFKALVFESGLSSPATTIRNRKKAPGETEGVLELLVLVLCL